MSVVIPHSLLTDFDIQLFRAGKHFKLYEKLGNHPITLDNQMGTYFAVWAPNAKQVAVIGNFNAWNKSTHQLSPRWDSSGIWEGFIPGVLKGELYKYSLTTYYGEELEKGDPFANFWEVPPNTSSITWDLDYQWKDADWLQSRKAKEGQAQPYSVYEVHMGSWKKVAADKSLSYTELANELVSYVQEMGFTHIEFMPVMEHPYFPSWGYQITGYFAPTSRFGTPQEFMQLVDAFHQAGIGVILDWVPSHFPEDKHGLGKFDGTALYEHEDPRKGFHPDWKSLIFNYGRNEVRSFLISNALFWLDKFHIDGLRVDAVASMLYLDYSREAGEWIPNEHGGNENYEAIKFIEDFNIAVYEHFPDAVTIAEESTAWSGVSRPTYAGGLGFGQKWMMGWMHDTLEFFKEDPINRKYHQGKITFSMVYGFSENFMLPLSHDEVVYGKGALIDRMPGDEWQRFANLRLLFGYMYTHPGTKLFFMGGEIGQTTEWSIERGVEWWLTQHATHKGVQTLVKDLNAYYKNTPALYDQQFEPSGFEWIEHQDNENSFIAYLRKGQAHHKAQVVVCNFTPNPRTGFRIGVPNGGQWKEVINTDAVKYNGSGVRNEGILTAEAIPWHGREYSLLVTFPPLGMVAFEEV